MGKRTYSESQMMVIKQLLDQNLENAKPPVIKLGLRPTQISNLNLNNGQGSSSNGMASATFNAVKIAKSGDSSCSSLKIDQNQDLNTEAAAAEQNEANGYLRT